MSDELQEATSLLIAAGYGVIAPNGDCVGNVGLLPDGAMALGTARKPLYGLLTVWGTSDA